MPQQRRRLFLLGVRKDIAQKIAYPTGKCDFQPPRPTVMEAIRDLPSVDGYDRLFKENIARFTRKPRSPYAMVARGTACDLSDLSRPRDWDENACSGCLRTRHSTHTIELYSATPPGDVVPGHKLPRLHPNGICPTLRAGSDSKHGSYTAPRPIHPIHPRCITSREAARLHGFPDWFSFYPLKWHAYRQIGNAVCPQVARAVGYAVRSVLGGKTTSIVPPAIRLDDKFLLPDDRPRTLKRIPQLEQFPPVIGFLFDEAYDKRANRMRKASFSFADVNRAVAATGVDLHWVRAETFLQEIARSRRVQQMLAAAMDFGFSIVPCSGGDAIGKFVRIGTPGTLETKESLQIRIDEIKSADRLPMAPPDLNGTGWGVVAVLTQPKVQEKIWRRDDCVVGIVAGSNDGALGGSSVYTLTVRSSPKFELETTAVFTCKAAALPTKMRLAKISKERKTDRITILAKATDRHIVALQFDRCSTDPREIARAAFEFDATSRAQR